MPKLLIVESPGKKGTLAKILGSDWKIMASVGHVRDLPEKEMGVDQLTFVPRYEPTERGRSVLGELRKAVAEADDVYLATDLDREGESISWHLKESLRLPSPKRVSFSEITAEAVRAAVASPRAIDMNMVSAQQGRRVLDRFVGFLVTTAIRNATGQSLTAGRVQSPAVRIVVDRERAIRDFQCINHFGVRLTFENGEDRWTADWDVSPLLAEAEKYWIDEAFAQRVSTISAVTVESFEDSERRRSPPPPFITATLQRAAFKAFKFRPKTTMALAQKLYEVGAITYMRTDQPNLSESALVEIRAITERDGLPLAPAARRWKAKEGAQEAHEAIRPCHFEWGADEVRSAGSEHGVDMTADHLKLYQLIHARALASQLADAIDDVRTVVLKATDGIEGKPIHFKASGITPRFDGWECVGKPAAVEQEPVDDEAAPKNRIPQFAVEQALTACDGKVVEKSTRPPLRFTQDSLIAELERLGIGRPSTYSNIGC